MNECNYGVVNLDTGEVIQEINEIVRESPGEIVKSIKPDTRYLKFYIEPLLKLKLPNKTLIFFIDSVLKNMHRQSNMVRSSTRKPLRGNLTQVSTQLNLKRSTLCRHFALLLEHDVLRKYRDAYYVNIKYAYYFNRNKFAPVVEEVFPDMITERYKPY